MERERACVVHCAVPGDEQTFTRLMQGPLCGAGLDRGDSVVFSPEIADCPRCKALAAEQSA